MLFSFLLQVLDELLLPPHAFFFFTFYQLLMILRVLLMLRLVGLVLLPLEVPSPLGFEAPLLLRFGCEVSFLFVLFMTFFLESPLLCFQLSRFGDSVLPPLRLAQDLLPDRRWVVVGQVILKRNVVGDAI